MSSGFTVQGKDWYSKTISIDDAVDQINDAKRQRVDIECPLKHMRLGLNDDNQIVMEYLDGREYVPTEHALKQMATWMSVSHTFLSQYSEPVLNQNGTVRYKRDKQDAEILLSVFRNGIRDNRVDADKEFRFRTYTDGTLRAMLSDIYNVIDNTWYMRALQDTFRRIGGDEPRVMKWRGDADTLYGNLLLPDTVIQESDSDYGGMISISNCEIGIRRLSLTPSIFRGICTNGVIFGKVLGITYSKVHRGKLDSRTINTDIFCNLQTQIAAMSKGLTAFQACKELKWADNVQSKNLFAQLALDNKFSQGMKSQAFDVVSEFNTHEINNTNLFGIINAITRSAQNQNPIEWVRFDEVAGSMLMWNNKDWDNFQNRAKALDTKVRDKVFGIVAA